MITKAYVKTGVVNLLFFIQTKIICALIWMTHTEHYNFPSNNPIHFNLVAGNTLKVNYCICFFPSTLESPWRFLMFLMQEIRSS